MAGLERPFAATIKARLSNEMPLDPRPEYMRVILSWDGQDPVANVMTTGSQVGASLFRKRRFMLDEMYASKFGLFLEYENTCRFFFHFVLLYFFPNECTGLC